jgi:hypothetical protein
LTNASLTKLKRAVRVISIVNTANRSIELLFRRQNA